MDRAVTTLFMLMSVDGKIKPGHRMNWMSIKTFLI